MRLNMFVAIATVAGSASGAPNSPDAALLAPLDEAVGITANERASASDLMNAMLKIQHAYLVDGHMVPKPVADFDRCIMPRIEGGGYTFADGGVSAWRLRLACNQPAKVLIEGCKQRFGIGLSEFYPHCSIEPILLAQAAMSIISRP
jgi:hypothetical protein